MIQFIFQIFILVSTANASFSFVALPLKDALVYKRQEDKAVESDEEENYQDFPLKKKKKMMKTTDKPTALSPKPPKLKKTLTKPEKTLTKKKETSSDLENVSKKFKPNESSVVSGFSKAQVSI